jgi:hypothetical protein
MKIDLDKIKYTLTLDKDEYTIAHSHDNMYVMFIHMKNNNTKFEMIKEYSYYKESPTNKYRNCKFPNCYMRYRDQEQFIARETDHNLYLEFVNQGNLFMDEKCFYLNGRKFYWGESPEPQEPSMYELFNKDTYPNYSCNIELGTIGEMNIILTKKTIVDDRIVQTMSNVYERSFYLENYGTITLTLTILDNDQLNKDFLLYFPTKIMEYKDMDTFTSKIITNIQRICNEFDEQKVSC